MLVSVGVEHYRSLAELLFKAVGVEFCLLLPDTGIPSGPLGFDQPQRAAVIAPENVVDKPFALLGRHSCNPVFPVLGPVQWPPGLLQQQVNEGVTCLGLVVVVRVWCGLVGLLGGRDLSPELSDLLFESGPFGFADQPFLLREFPSLGGIGEATCDLLQLLEGSSRDLRCPG